jgi:hypothetical protein
MRAFSLVEVADEAESGDDVDLITLANEKPSER